MPSPLDSPFVSVATAAEILAVSVSHIYALIRSGEIPALRVGRRGPWRISSGALAAFVSDRYETEFTAAKWREAQWTGVIDIADGRRL
jgi:excisionase family DNA binding protein